MKIEITVPAGVASQHWLRYAERRVRAIADLNGIKWVDAEVLVILPERGRCYAKLPGARTLGAHG